MALSLVLALCLSFATSGQLASAATNGDANADAMRAGEPGSGPPAYPFLIRRSVPHALAATIHWSDVPNSHWAHKAIDHVGKDNNWMRDYGPDEDGDYPFKPDKLETRKLLARAVVRAFVPDEPIDTEIHFKDLPDDAMFYDYANVAVKLGWMREIGGNFLPDNRVSMSTVHHVLVYALGLKDAAKGLRKIQTHNGVMFDTAPNFGTTVIGMRLGLRYNHSDESLDVNPHSKLPRSEVAWSLYRATTLASWSIDDMEAYADIELPAIGPKKQEFIQWGIDHAGYPYVWGGEWDEATSSGYCCGTQPVGGFDCSGLTWWVLKHQGGGWDNTPPRKYAGWDLPQRTSALMATVGNIGWNHLEVGDLMFYDGDDDGTVDHVDTYIGNGWSLDSGSSNAGVTITFTGDGSWYDDHFVHGRRIIK
ncbi:MAG TPA: NlpC/P60 family protein [Actinomycetota bacterium]|nr:NlpC/P60 family protein [Actinomycetota bacterium]